MSKSRHLILVGPAIVIVFSLFGFFSFSGAQQNPAITPFQFPSCTELTLNHFPKNSVEEVLGRTLTPLRSGTRPPQFETCLFTTNTKDPGRSPGVMTIYSKLSSEEAAKTVLREYADGVTKLPIAGDVKIVRSSDDFLEITYSEGEGAVLQKCEVILIAAGFNVSGKATSLNKLVQEAGDRVSCGGGPISGGEANQSWIDILAEFLSTLLSWLASGLGILISAIIIAAIVALILLIKKLKGPPPPPPSLPPPQEVLPPDIPPSPPPNI